MPYLLDTNVLITAKNFHYGFDFCPGFWSWVTAQHVAGSLYSVQRVREEIRRGNDPLVDWVNQLPDGFFLTPTNDTVTHFQTVSQWMLNQGYPLPQRAAFSAAADFNLVAQALQGGHTVVTYEAFQRQKGKIQIPDVCAGVGVTCIPPYALLRTERARFVLGAGA